MTYKVYFHAPRCTFNPDPIWDQKWNYMATPGIERDYAIFLKKTYVEQSQNWSLIVKF